MLAFVLISIVVGMVIRRDNITAWVVSQPLVGLLAVLFAARA